MMYVPEDVQIVNKHAVDVDDLGRVAGFTIRSAAWHILIRMRGGSERTPTERALDAVRAQALLDLADELDRAHAEVSKTLLAGLTW